MKRFKLSFALILFLTLCASTEAFSNGATYPENEYYSGSQEEGTKAENMEQEDTGVGPDPQRMFCKKYWNSYYSERDIDIEVTTRGEYDEVVVFNCPQCSLEEHYVDPFLNTETMGMTGLERIRACGFKKAVFIGSKGIREVERDI